MLFQLHPQTPKFRVFELLNQELIFFLEKSINQQRFGRRLFSYTPVGKACWNNVRKSAGKNDLTNDKFRKLHEMLRTETQLVRQRLHQVIIENQNLERFFSAPDPNLISFLSQDSFNAFKILATHLYEKTKDLQPIINEAGGMDILAHFNKFRLVTINGEICKACGLGILAPFRANVEQEDQWRSDYDHQLCKSDYPLFSVHPDNLIPLCDVCNKKAKGDANLFFKNSKFRHSFYPYTESAYMYVNLKLINLRDPEPEVKIEWTATDDIILNKLDTWNDIYEIKNRVEGQFNDMDQVIENEIQPYDYNEFESEVSRKTRPISNLTLKTKPGAYWYHKFFCELNSIDKSAFWEKSRFVHSNAKEGGDYILKR